MSDIPETLRYTKDHEWARANGADLEVGITKFAVDQLGDITLVSFDVKPGDTLTEGKAFGTVESVKSVSDLFAPCSGKVVRVNAELDKKPELVNEDPYGRGWMLVLTPADPKAADALMDAKAYADHAKA